MTDTHREMNDEISLCPSAPHRAVLGLLRVALGRAPGPSLPGDLGASAPEEIVRIATFNYVHTLLATAFGNSPELRGVVPDDLVIYFREMQAANLRRNAGIRAQLEAVGAALAGAGLAGVALKGGAELLDPVFPEPAWRFLSDIDILVAEPEVERAVAALRGLGALSSEISDVDRDAHHHAAPMGRPDWPVVVEVHRKLGQGAVGALIDPRAVLEAARPTPVPGLAVPSRAHRLAHAVLHAQLEPPRYRDGVLSPRDAVEMEVLETALGPAEVAAARALFEPDRGPAWEGLVAARALVFGPAESPGALPPLARRWAEAALVDFGRPGRRRWATLGRWAGWYAKEFVVNPERRRHYLRQLTRPGHLRRALADHKDRWFRTR